MQQIMEPNPAPWINHSEIADEFHKKLTLAEDVEAEEIVVDDDDDEDDDDDDDGDFEFSFAGNELLSPIAAEEVFQNGQIRPLFPFSDHYAGSSEEATTSYGPPVKKLFVVSSDPENEDVAEGLYCAWSPEKSPAPEMSRKSNSTGLSKLWKVKDMLVRSHSDGKDAFVFLTGKSEEKVEEDGSKKKKVVNLPAIKVGMGSRSETASLDEKNGKDKKKKKEKKYKSAYEALYGKREKTAGKSYLPYRQDLVGFFTNSNGLSRNVHPY